MHEAIWQESAGSSHFESVRINLVDLIYSKGDLRSRIMLSNHLLNYRCGRKFQMGQGQSMESVTKMAKEPASGYLPPLGPPNPVR